MKLEIKNLQSSATYSVAHDGAVLGREGSKADIVLRDQAVSKRHAKIYQKNGRWYLEDLESSNGTFLDNRRISEPVVLSAGMVFALSENQFEVVQISSNKASAEIDTGTLDAPHGIEDLPSPVLREGKSGRGARGRSAAAPRSGTLEVAPPPTPSQPVPLALDALDEEPLEHTPSRVGTFLRTLPRAAFYHLVTVPLLLFNPRGTVRKAISDPLLPELDAPGLVAYGIPVGLVLAVFGVVAPTVVGLLSGSVPFPLESFLVAVLVGLALSVLGGVLAHPVLTLVVDRILQGESDARGRSNHYVMSLAALLLVLLPYLFAPLLVQIPVPFARAAPGVLALGTMLIGLGSWFAWWRHFQVRAGFQIFMKGLGVLAVLGVGWGVVQVVLAELPRATSPETAGETPPKPSPGLDPRPLEGTALAAVLPEVKPGIAPILEPDRAAAPGPAPTPALVAPELPAENKEPAPGPGPVAREPEPAAPVSPPVAAPSPRAGAAAPERKGPSPDFQAFIDRRKAVEEAIEKDPTLLRRADVRTSYEKYLLKTFEVRTRWAKKKPKDPALQKVNDRLKDIEVFDETRKLVEDLHAKIF